jgi:hypothetical protein
MQEASLRQRLKVEVLTIPNMLRNAMDIRSTSCSIIERPPSAGFVKQQRSLLSRKLDSFLQMLPVFATQLDRLVLCLSIADGSCRILEFLSSNSSVH